jgi:outer membrane receptor for ferrienterochelin and colicins
MTRAGPLALSLLALAVAIAPARPARGDAIEARYFDERARAEFARHHYQSALELFLQVQSAAPSPGTLYNIGVSADLADQPSVAYTHLEDFVASPGADAEHAADAERRMRRLETILALVRVTTDPPGATVWVDRRALGSWGQTPRTLVLEPGLHTLELELSGHRTERLEVTLARGAATEVQRQLAPELGEVRVEGVPGGARVLAIDALGAEREVTVSPGDAARTIALPVGPYRMRAELAGHRADERDVVVQTGEPAIVRLSLSPVAAPTGRLLATAGDVRATVVVDGAPRAETPARIDAIAEGPHEVELRADGHVTWRGTVTVVADRSAFVDVTLVPQR